VISLDIIGVSRIRFGKRELTPASPQLFAIALYLSAEGERRIPRSELQNLLFSEVPKQSARSHSLRQLLYRLSSAGFPVESRDDALWVASSRVRHGITELQERSTAERLRLSPADLEILPAYSPSFSPPLCDWVDALRTKVARRVRALLEEDLATLQRAYAWDGVAQTSKTLLALEPLHYDAVRALTESCLLRGRPADALAAVNEYLDEHADVTSQQCSTVARLRHRLVAEMRSPVAAPFVGRADCIAFLSRAWDMAAAGTAQAVLVTGAAGIGKSRAMAVLCDYSVLRGARCVKHTCGSNDRHRPLALFAHIAERLLSLRGALGISPLARKHIGRLCDAGAPPTPASPDPIASEVARTELQDALVDLVDAVSSEGPLLLAIDDAHLLDAASWTVLREISRKITDRPLLVILCTRSAQHPTRSRLPVRLQTFSLAPLSEDDSRTLLLALAPDRVKDHPRLEHDVHTSAGNPLLIHALARYTYTTSGSANVPVDISVLAASSYYSLDQNTRTLLESVLHLRELSTLSRLRMVSQLDDTCFLRSLRDLEEEGLVRLFEGGVECSHDLIAEALRALTPRTVAAVLNGRIAAQLEAECVDNRMDPSLAWAAAQAWMNAAEPTAAVRLVRRCAANAAALGEAVEAARMLERLLDVALPADELLSLTADLINYSDAGCERHLRARAMEVRIRLLQEDPYRSRATTSKELSELRVMHLEDKLHEAGDLTPLLDQLRSILVDHGQEIDQRVRAAVTLMISADLLFDRDLAHFAWRETTSLTGSAATPHAHALRVQLIYHTVFGDVTTAITIARELLAGLSEATLAYRIAWRHRNALFALHTLGCSSDFHPPASAIHRYTRARGVYSTCAYIGSLISDCYMQEGDIEAAIDWTARIADDVRRVHPTAGGVTQGFFSTLAFLASTCDRLEAASKALAHFRRRLPLVHTPRLRAVDSALWMRLGLMRGDTVPSDETVSALHRDYQLGSTFGRQDSVVEALWLAFRARGENARSSELLRDYLALRRREPSPPDWSLRYATRVDCAWTELGFEAAGAPCVGSTARAKLDAVLDSLESDT
jgi:DNA-binding SARP family transcriptional activator